VSVDDLVRDARARLLAGDLDGARSSLESAAEAWRQAGNATEEARCLRLATALARHADFPAEAVALAADAVASASDGLSIVDDLARLAEADVVPESASALALLASARAVDRHDLAGARVHAERARAQALAERSPIGYVAAAIAQAALAETAGDRVGAYASLAVGWATLRDLVGPEPARDAFAPRLLELRARWGVADFAAVKAAYEARVRTP